MELQESLALRGQVYFNVSQGIPSHDAIALGSHVGHAVPVGVKCTPIMRSASFV